MGGDAIVIDSIVADAVEAAQADESAATVAIVGPPGAVIHAGKVAPLPRPAMIMISLSKNKYLDGSDHCSPFFIFALLHTFLYIKFPST